VTPNPPPLAEQQPRSRYPGTQPFGDSPEDQARFFGRDAEAEQLYLRVLSVPLLVQFGRSGLGKTSLLQAGLFPRLRQKPFLPTMIRLNDTKDSLTAAVTRSLQEACDAEGLEFVADDTSSLWRLLATTSIWRGDLLVMPVLVFDQFEEVFTLRDAEFRRTISAELGAIASAKAGSAPPMKIVISLREDYLGGLEEFSAAIPALFHERLRLEAMSEEAARAAITGPAQLEPAPHEPPYASPRFSLDPPALDAMVDYLLGSSGVIEPFQLQLLCGHAEGIAARKGAEPVKLTLDDFHGAQGFAAVLRNFYRGTLDKISPQAQRRRAAALCEEGLLDAAGHRLMLHEGQILANYRVEPQTLAMLCQTRLIRTERRLESTFYEISHDRLAESIIAARQGRLPKKVRRAMWAAGAAALIVVALLMIWNRSVERQRQAAQTARDSAEGLLTFLLGEQFLGEIRDTGRSTMLEAVRKEVEGSGTAGRSPLNRALALRHEGDMRRIENDLPRALKFQRQSLAVVEALGNDRESARGHARVAQVLDEQGQDTDALARYELSVQAWARVTGTPEAGADDCVEMAEALSAKGRLYEASGRSDRSAEDYEHAVRIASNVLFGGRGPCATRWESITPYPHAGAVAMLSEVAHQRSQVPGVNENAESTAAMADHARRLQPQSVKARRSALVTLLSRGTARQPAEAFIDLQDVLAGFDELGRWDPRNQTWTRDRAIAQLNLAWAITYCRSASSAKPCSPMPPLGTAEAMTLEALTTLRGLAAADRTNAELHGHIVIALLMHASVLSASGNHTAALARLKEAEGVWRTRRPDPADTLSLLDLGQVLQQQAYRLLALRRPAEAVQILARAIAVYEPLQRKHPDNPRYLQHLISARSQENMLRMALGDAAGATAAAREVARLGEAREGARRPLMERTASLAATEFDLWQKATDLLHWEKKFSESLHHLTRVEAGSRERITLFPADFTSYSTIGVTYMTIAEAQKELGNPAGQMANLAAAMNAAQVAAWLAPDHQREPRNLALLDARNDVVEALFARKRAAEALPIVRENIVLAEQMAESPTCIKCRWLLGVAKCLFASGQSDVSADGLRSGLIHLESASKASPRSGEIATDLGYWRVALADELEKSGAKTEADAQRRLALAAYRQAGQNQPKEDVKAAIAKLEKLLGPELTEPEPLPSALSRSNQRTPNLVYPHPPRPKSGRPIPRPHPRPGS